jgi:hypothetical protein
MKVGGDEDHVGRKYLDLVSLWRIPGRTNMSAQKETYFPVCVVAFTDVPVEV